MGLKHPEQLSIKENKAADINSTPAGKNKRVKKPATVKEPKLDFEDVKRVINPALVEGIFRHYGQPLNPDGKIEKKGNQLFCGSLNINLRDGRWYRFSDGSKGDIFALVKEAAGVDTKGTFEIVAVHAGIGPKTVDGISSLKNSDLNGLEKAKTRALQKEETWLVLDKIPENALAFKPEKDLARTLKKNNWRLAATYEYKNRDGELLGYLVRVLDDQVVKHTLPVSYCHNTKANINRWWLKGFSDNGYKPIYRAEKLGQSPLQRVLIVEGEKAAGTAAKIFPEHTVISWMGGSAAASKANWKAVGGREVTVWPDNDAAGEKAAKAIITEINKVNGFRGAVNIVDTHALNLPEKWDLADELPAYLTRKDLAAAISNAKIPENENRLDNELAGQVRAVLCDKEFGDYVNYGVKRGKIDPGHDYLDLNDALYREMLTASVVSFMQENHNTKEALKMNELLKEPVRNIPELAVNILEIYKSSRNSRNNSNFAASRQTNSNSKELAELNPAKAKLYEELMQDFVWLHQKQSGMESLNKVHQDKLSQDLARIINGYNLSYKGSDKTMSDSDRKIIADNAYNLIDSKGWQEELKKIELACKEKTIYKTQEKLTILNRVKELALNKQKTDNSKDALIALKREQEYLAELHNKLNPNEHSKELMYNIQKAYEVDQSGTIAKLYKTSYYANQQGIISPEELTEHFKSNNQVDDIHHNINRICYKHHCDILNDHCKKLVAGQSVMHQGQQFDCVVEYLEHWKDNVNHDMLPIKKMDQVIEQVERIREQDHQFTPEL